MEEQKPAKSFWRKYELLIITLCTLLFVYFVVVLNQKINFLLGNELIVYLDASRSSFDVHYGDVSEARFGISVDNAAYCRAMCSYSFNDRNTNSVVGNGTFEIGKQEHFSKSYNLSVRRLGSGQDIYSFDVSCRSIRSFICLTNSPEKMRSSLVTLNYDLNETEKALKMELRQNVTRLLKLLSDVDVMHQKVNQKYFELAHKIDLSNLSAQKIGIDDSYDKTRVAVENLRSIWAVENYMRLNWMFNQSFFETLGGIKSSIESLDSSIDNIVGTHNELLEGLSKLSSSLSQLEAFSGEIEDNAISNATGAAVKKFNLLASSVENNTFNGYGSLVTELGNVVELQASAISMSRIPAAELFFDSGYYLNYEKDLLCSLRQDCSSNFSISEILSDTGKFIYGYPNLTPALRNCNLISELDNEFSGIRNGTSAIIAGSNITFPQNDRFLALAAMFLDSKIRAINNSYIASLETAKSKNITQDAIGIAGSLVPKNATAIAQPEYNQSLNLSLYLLSQIAPIGEINEMSAKCRKLEEPGHTGNFDFSPISISANYSAISMIDTNLSDNPPICCVFNDCNPCCTSNECRNNPKTFPVILLHGHSFARDNSPEFSLDAFNRLQAKLQEDGYLNAGIVSLYSQNEQLEPGVWGLSGKPVTVKVSYYYDAFREGEKYIAVPTKSEDIDTYALRLRDLIGMVKERTGKPKVNIIAHSMGALVARRYVQIFGEDDIDKLVMIAPPNKGISSPVSDICGFVGENRECNDMEENSLFMNKLNDPSKQPAKVRLYSVIGSGCTMKFGDGDGIITARQAALENSRQYYVNGTCGGLFGSKLHTEMLNIDKYPETYRIVKGILKE